jgi:ABC-type cobalamin/Fe3+-siderophores transport system ATPase subunit
LSVFRSIFIEKSQIIVLVSPLDYLDILTRIRVEKYLIDCKQISILISLTNITEVISLYKRHLHFQEGKYTETS